MTDEPVVAVPADLELEERLVGPVTFRTAAWLAASAAGAVLLGVGQLTAARGAVGVPLLVVGLVGAFWRPGGRAAPTWLRPIGGYLRRRRVDRRQPEDPTPATSARRRQLLTAAGAVLLLVAAFSGGRLARSHLRSPAAPAPAPAATTPAPTSPLAPVNPPAPTDPNPWSDCGC